MDVLLGLQWGDEGKGKVVDVLATEYDYVVRFQGGPNAGHTLEFDDKKVVLHQIPSGAFRNTIKNVIGNGLVIDASILKKEIETLKSYGCDIIENLYVSKKAHLILPTHKLLDASQEKSKGDKKIGSTLKGIGPAYQDKIGRQGLRLGDIFYDDFKERYIKIKERHLSNIDNEIVDNLDKLENEFFEAIKFAKKLKIIDTDYFLNEALSLGHKILLEGAQGTLLDVDFGSYPFVTSSNTFVGGVSQGTGLPPSHINRVIGIFKAYCTRVGSGPFPSELLDNTGEALRVAGHEFGSTTGRPRRCGWLDLPALKYATMINGVTELAITKADVLSGFDQIKICTEYQLSDGSKIDRLPYDLDRDHVEPQYQIFEGWNEDLTDAKSFNELPDSLKDYLMFIENYLGIPIKFISLGPNRSQCILK